MAWHFVLPAVLLVFSCTGDTGPEGPAGMTGTDGMTGSDGPPGPLAEPPALASLSPRWGSANTHVTITGIGFSTTATDNHVFFDGHAATVISATATQLVVTPDVATDSTENVVVSVEVANQVSNALAFELVASGTARFLGIPLPTAPTGVVTVGGDIYIASGVNGVARSGGLFKLSNGVVTQVVRGDLVTVSLPSGPVEIMDGPVAVATFGGDVYFTTTFGAVRKYTVATGAVTDVLVLANAAGNAFPPRTGIAFDAGGDMYVLDRNASAVIRLRTNKSVAFIQDNSLGGAYGMASDGTDLFITNEASSVVHRITNLAGAPIVGIFGSATAVPYRGIAIVGTNVIIATDTGRLYSSPKASASFTAFGDTSGYIYDTTGLAASGNDLLLAQPNGGVVRRKPAASTASTIVAAGVRYALGTVALGGKLYVASRGAAIFSGGLSLPQPDGAVVEISLDGTSRVLATTEAPFGLAVKSATQLAVSDCPESRIFTLDITTAAQTNILTGGDFVFGCPGGITVDSTGALYYVDIDPTTTSIGKLVGTTQTPGVVTGINNDAFALTLAGMQLVTTSLFEGVPLQKGAVTGGAATTLVPQAVFASGSLSASPDGALYGLRALSTELVSIDTTTGVVTPLGSTVPPDRALTTSLIGSFTVGTDHTVTAMDFAQGDFVSIAP